MTPHSREDKSKGETAFEQDINRKDFKKRESIDTEAQGAETSQTTKSPKTDTRRWTKSSQTQTSKWILHGKKTTEEEGKEMSNVLGGRGK